MANPFYVAGSMLLDVLKNAVSEFVRILPGLVAAIILVLIGWLLAKIVRRLAMWAFKVTGIDKWIKRNGISNALMGFDVSYVLTGLLKWYIILVIAELAVRLIETNFTLWLSENWHFSYFALVFCLGLTILLLIGEYFKQKIIQSSPAFLKGFTDIIKILVVYLGVIVMLQLGGYSIAILTRVFEIAFIAFAIAVAIIIGIGFAISYSDETAALINKFSRKK
jgi:hypothetical protein